MSIIKSNRWLRPKHFMVLAANSGLAGRGGSSDNDPEPAPVEPDPQPELQSYEVPLEGDQEVPAVQTDAYGQGYLLYDSSNGALTLNAWTWDLTATAAHIHHAEAGTNGDVIVRLEESADTEGLWQLPDDTVLGTDEVSALEMANLYVNAHTEANPGGEIRGQVLTTDRVMFPLMLSGDNEVPPVETMVSGEGAFTQRPIELTQLASCIGKW